MPHTIRSVLAHCAVDSCNMNQYSAGLHAKRSIHMRNVKQRFVFCSFRSAVHGSCLRLTPALAAFLSGSLCRLPAWSWKAVALLTGGRTAATGVMLVCQVRKQWAGVQVVGRDALRLRASGCFEALKRADAHDSRAHVMNRTSIFHLLLSCRNRRHGRYCTHFRARSSSATAQTVRVLQMPRRWFSCPGVCWTFSGNGQNNSCP